MAKGNTPIKSEKVVGSKQQISESSSLSELDLRRVALQKALVRHGAFDNKDDRGVEERPIKGAGQAIKISSEFLAGVVVGVVLGLGFDKLIGTSPWGLIVFVMAGFSAGVLNVLRSLGRVPQSTLGKKGTGHHTGVKSE